MEAITINIINIAGSTYCVESEDGQKVFNLISKALKENQNVVLSFLNVEIITTAFLNTAIGQLYGSFCEELIQKHLGVKDLSNIGTVSLKRVVNTAKLYYKDPDAMQRSINEILGE
jgi:hypothetical protein